MVLTAGLRKATVRLRNQRIAARCGTLAGPAKPFVGKVTPLGGRRDFASSEPSVSLRQLSGTSPPDAF
jgi:hypothetical protein